MTNIEQKIFNIIQRKKNARIQHIASAAEVSSAYASLVCQGLDRRGYINFARGLAVIPVLADTPDEESQIPEPSAAPTSPIEEQETQETETEEVKLPEEENTAQAASIFSFKGLKKDIATTLEGAGYRTVADLAEAPISKLMQHGGMNVKQAADLINKAKVKSGIIKVNVIQ